MSSSGIGHHLLALRPHGHNNSRGAEDAEALPVSEEAAVAAVVGRHRSTGTAPRRLAQPASMSVPTSMIRV